MSTLIVGAGVAGLGAAHALAARGIGFLILEASDAPGGLARTDCVGPFGYDRTGHFLHFSRPEVQGIVQALPVPLESIRRRAAVLVGDAVVPYPFQYNLWALNRPEVSRHAFESVREVYAAARYPPASLADVLRGAWGEVMLDLFFRPYNEKLWGRTLETLPPDCAGDFLPRLDLALVEEGCRHATTYGGYNGQFLYPTSGRFGDVAEALAAPVRGALRLGTAVEEIDLGRRVVRMGDGCEIRFQQLVSTMPLSSLLQVTGLAPAPAGLLDFTSVCNVRVGLRGRMLTDLHWVYVPDRSVDFHRVGFPANLNPRTCPPDCISLSIEYTLPNECGRRGASEIARSAVDYLVGAKLIEVDEWVVLDEIVLSPAYVVWRSADRAWFQDTLARLREYGVLTAGRFGSWDYLSVEGAFLSGTAAAAAIPPPSLLEASLA